MSPDTAEAVRRPLSPLEAALVAEACSRSDTVWLRLPGEAHTHAVWHVWHDDAVCLVYGTGEQQLPILPGEVEVIARSKETGAQVVAFHAQVDALTSRTPEWEAAAHALSAARLNARDLGEQGERWATGAVVSLLRPVAVTAAARGDDDTPSGAAPPAGNENTTLTRKPFHLGTRTRRALRLRRRRGDQES